MLNYEDLNKSPNGMPTWDSLIPVVMSIAVKEDKWKARELRQKVADSISMPHNLRNYMYESGNGNVIEDRVGWAMSLLKVAGLIATPRRGVGEVTELGRTLEAKYGNQLNDYIVKKQPKYIAHQKMLNERKIRDGSIKENIVVDIATNDITELLSKESISDIVKSHNQEIATQLLEKILNEEPIFFENLVVELLVAMGYKGMHGTSIVTNASRDGGIDGIINQDPLGTSTVYIQAKRHQSANKIQRQHIDGFYGALKRIHADRGVFITTSSFSEAAEEAAKGFSIVMIDGIKLTNLMLQYNVGVRIKETYNLYEIDEEFFEID